MALPKLIVVLGTTACGKSGLGVELAKRFGGEIDAFFVHAASPQATFYDAWRQNAMRERRECVKL